MRYKVGDKVRIKSKEWYDANKNSRGVIGTPMGFIKGMSDFCGKEATIKSDGGNSYELDIDDGRHLWDDDMLEDYLSDTPEKSTISTDLIKDIAEVVKSHNLGVCISEKDGKLIVEPLEEKEEDLVIDTPCMCSNHFEGEYAWFVRYYAGNKQTWWGTGKSTNEKRKVAWKYIIPWDKFNPNNIEESLKYNIVK